MRPSSRQLVLAVVSLLWACGSDTERTPADTWSPPDAPIAETTDAADDTPASDADPEVAWPASQCWEHKSGTAGGPDYDQYDPVVGSHCLGTNHQDIDGMEQLLGHARTVSRPDR